MASLLLCLFNIGINFRGVLVLGIELLVNVIEKPLVLHGDSRQGLLEIFIIKADYLRFSGFLLVLSQGPINKACFIESKRTWKYVKLSGENHEIAESQLFRLPSVIFCVIIEDVVQLSVVFLVEVLNRGFFMFVDDLLFQILIFQPFRLVLLKLFSDFFLLGLLFSLILLLLSEFPLPFLLSFLIHLLEFVIQLLFSLF